MIHFEQVSKRYLGGHEALKSLTFNMAPGEMAFLTGHSGAGKSTLLKMIALIEKPSSGHIRIAGQILNRMSRRQIPFFRRQIGLVFQNHNLLMDRSVYDNVALPLLIEGESPREIGRRVRAALDKVGLLEREAYLPIMLSGGEQQRVGIARAVVTKPKLLLADEPTGNLDPKLSREVMNLFADFNRVGTTVLIASHDLGLIARMPFRVMTLKNGELVRGADGGERGPN
ncbi:cell division ATP-binding protein FtsE [Gynuella sunshinyii]|uniref:Cell division ATP-binding protein FtsE n=1 Tax=Gynuella sunshinyii YC6258 TaxID=1445510 RepID=A0A0C5VJI8_9GAMM|nr:cell division ATP-binding protein FtsE [Gynuella sunshinyii]AJQ93563.1 putative ATPase involved in cell division [Gynuella sunshinyii YC6258]